MKPKNFPARKKRRQLIAQRRNLHKRSAIRELEEARAVRTKKERTQ